MQTEDLILWFTRGLTAELAPKWADVGEVHKTFPQSDDTLTLVVTSARITGGLGSGPLKEMTVP